MASDALVAANRPNDHEDVHEEVDDVQVEVECREHVLLGGEGVLVRSAHHQLGVVDDVEAEYGRASRPVANTGVARIRSTL